MARDIRYQIAIDKVVDEQLSRDLSLIEVVEAVRGESTFKVRFQIDICNNDFELLDDDRLVPGKDRLLTVLVSVDGEQSCLIHGLITDRKTELKEGGAGSSLEITGKDRRIEMGRNADQHTTLSGTTGLIVMQKLASYALIPDVEQGDTALYSELTGARNQAGSDLELLKSLAAETGYEFWVDAEVVRVAAGFVILKETGHFRSQPPRGAGPISISLPAIIAPSGAPTLKLNPGTGCSTLLSFASERVSEVPNGSGQIPRADFDSASLQQTTVDGPSLEAFGQRPPAPQNRRPVVSPGNAAEARRRQDAALIDASWIVNARAETTAHAVGNVIRPRQIVKVEGTGSVDDGDYFVWKVTHSIDTADHKMSLELRRNGVGAA